MLQPPRQRDKPEQQNESKESPLGPDPPHKLPFSDAESSPRRQALTLWSRIVAGFPSAQTLAKRIFELDRPKLKPFTAAK